MALRKNKGRNRLDYIDVIANIFMVLFSISILYPMIHVVAVSLSSSGPITRNEVTLFPVQFTLDSYLYFTEHTKFVRGFFNGVWYTVEGVAANMIATAVLITLLVILSIYFILYFLLFETGESVI